MKRDLILTAVVAFALGWLACEVMGDARAMDQAAEARRLERMVCFHRQVSTGYVPCGTFGR